MDENIRHRPGEKNLQNTYLIKDLYPKCAKNTHNLTIRKETTQQENGQNSEQISHQRRYIDGKKNIWKDSQLYVIRKLQMKRTMK